MVAEAAANDQSERLLKAPESKPMASSDAQSIVNSSARDKQIVEADRTNQSSGSLAELTLKNQGLTREQIAARMQEQGDSISIDYGNGRDASRKSGLKEKDLVTVDELDKRPIRDYGWGFNSDNPPKVETGVEYQVGSQIEFKAQHNKAEITDHAVFERVAAMPIDKQAQILSAGIQAYQQEINHQQFRVAVGEITGVGESVVGMAQGVDSLGKSICDVAQFSWDLAENNPRAADTAEQASQSFGKLLVGGIRVVEVADGYLGSLGAASYEGDNTKAFRDISGLGQRINQRWSEMSTEEKTSLTTRLTLDNLGPIAAAGAGAKLAKSIDVAGALQDLGASASVFGGRERDKYSRVIGEMVEKLTPQPMGVTPDGRLMPIPKDRLKADGNMLMSKADDSLSASTGKHNELQPSKPEKPLEVTKEALDNPEGLANFAKKFGINMPPKDTYVFAGEKDAISAEAAAKRLGVTKEQLEKLDEAVLAGKKLERVADYRDAFFNKHPGLIPVADRIYVHHAIPKWVLKDYANLFTAKELNEIGFLRGITKTDNSLVHNKDIHNAWNDFKLDFPNPTRQQVLEKVRTIDRDFGEYFIPPVRGQ
jgi:hypothetical protein